MAARFRTGATLAQICSDLGYRGDIGYQTFLYSSESDLRRVFMFLIDKLPKDSEKEANGLLLSRYDELERKVGNILVQQFSRAWLPHYCHKVLSGGHRKIPFRSVDVEVISLNADDNVKDYQTRYQLAINEQLPSPNTLMPSVISSDSRILYSKPCDISPRIDWLNSKLNNNNININNNDNNNTRLMSRFSLNERLSTEKTKLNKTPEKIKSKNENKEIEEPKNEEREEEKKEQSELKVLKAECDALRSEYEELVAEVGKLEGQLVEERGKVQEAEVKFEKFKEEHKVKNKIYELLDDGENNVKKLEEAIEAGKGKLVNLAEQWEKHRAPLINQYRDQRDKFYKQASTSQKKLDELRQLKETERELLEECQRKDQQYTQLLSEVSKLPKDMNRSAYTQRILEIINNVRKQKDEIDKVLADTREIQKEINILTGKVERSFTVVDELIFRDAKTNETSRKAYKLLATLHTDCAELINLVEETGTVVREIRDLEEQIDTESKKNIGANLERITADLEQMRQETASLTAQLEKKRQAKAAEVPQTPSTGSTRLNFRRHVVVVLVDLFLGRRPVHFELSLELVLDLELDFFLVVEES
ncbi:Similar to v1g180167: Coiled-coil domain-containing protein 22 homolog (Nematostella vectensis) [Cotesia congregata]|uniref:Coiled-coil domain-containing protein 22 homolog n=1 Tax=Cotesia congregata TaxID=51543 RepID=A0A8J2ED01_COTCN|nr:Similar to v1g180167: Coiled-coil domain-containing protein 22 homolog (Nematostella vectensis) [Cotesia congregata]